MRARLSAISILLSSLLAACSSAGGGDAVPPGPAETACDVAAQLPAEARQIVVEVPVPQDEDPLTEPLPQSNLYVTALLPARCPQQTFPLIVQSHGYGGSRRTALAADGTLYPQDPGLDAIDELTTALPYHGYVVISVDQRGHGESQPQNGGGYARVNDPRYEVADFRALLDYAWEHADDLHIQRESSAVAHDLKVGTLGYSYGGGIQMPLAALDARIDAIVPVATWHDLLYSLMVDGANKQSWVQTLCLFAVTPSDGATEGSINTPLMDTLCNNAAIRDPFAYQIRTLSELVDRVSADGQRPRPVSEDEFMAFFRTHAMSYFRRQQLADQPWGFGETKARLRSVPALFVQGNRDGLFNLNDAYWNWRYFRESGSDARLITMESGHLTPVAGQVDGTANCGALKGVEAILSWFDDKLKGLASTADAIPTVCISVQASPGAPETAEQGVELASYPLGSLTGEGALPVSAERVEATVAATDGVPVFVPLITIPSAGYVLAGSPTVSRSTVTPGLAATHEAIAIVGVGIRRGGSTFLVDDQVTALLEGTATTNRFVDEGDPVLLPGVGEALEAGDELGLLFYEQSVQYSVVPSLTVATTLIPGGAVAYVAGKPIPNITSDLLTPVANIVTNPNPYQIVLEGVRVPVFAPGRYAGSRLTAGLD